MPDTIEFTAPTLELKRAFSIVSSGVAEGVPDEIGGHALLELKEDELVLCATDKNKMAKSSVAVSVISREEGSTSTKFTAEPKKMMAILGESGLDSVRFVYSPDTKTLNVYSSEHSGSFLSLVSLDPEQFLSFENEFSIAQEIKNVDADMFVHGLRFSTGFLPPEDGNKFSNIFILSGAMFSSNGSNKMGVFGSSDLDGIDSMIIRKVMISSIIGMIDKSKISRIILKHTSKLVVITSQDGKVGFGFRKTTTEAPKIPISLDTPELDCFNVDRKLLLKKVNRLNIAAAGDFGLDAIIEGDALCMNSLGERQSTESIACKRVKGTENLALVLDSKVFKSCLDLFKASNVDIYVDAKSYTVMSSASIEVQEDKTGPVRQIPFTAVAKFAQARKI